MSITLFTSRLVLYLIAVTVPAVHPAVVVGYDMQAALIWFVLVPIEMVIAYALAPPRMSLHGWLLLAAAPVAAAGVVIGIDASPTTAVIAGTLGFALTAALFHIGPRVRFLFAVEQTALAALYLRLLAFSRSSEDVALEAAEGATQLIFLLLIAGFLLHGIVISLVLAKGDPARRHLAASPATQRTRWPSRTRTGRSWEEPGARRSRREIGVFLAAALPVLLLTAFVLPTDFVQHNPVVNLLNPPDHDRPEPLDEQARGQLDEPGGSQSMDGIPGGAFGNGETPRDGSDQASGSGDDSELYGVDASDWSDNANGEQGNDQQRAVMIVRSDTDPTYLAEGYRGEFHEERGFIRSEEQPLNDLVRQRLAGTWQHQDPSRDMARERSEIEVFSTLEDRVLAYEPFEVEPTVYQPQHHPFSYSYRSVSNVSNAGERQFERIEGVAQDNTEERAEYLEIPLEEEHEQAFEQHIAERIGQRPSGYYERIEAIMESFTDFQYELGYDDSFRPDHQARFVSQTMSGDCVEFAVTSAILGRMMDIPARVVTGYLASSGLQNQAHYRGLAVLQNNLPNLQQYSLEELFLVTTSHRHAWVQYYMPGYGWVDFDPTAYAIPPDPEGDPNERQVVVPIIEPRQQPRSTQFPWQNLANILLWIVIAAVAGLYLYRYGTELFLSLRARGSDDRAVRARYRLLLMHLAALGYELKGTGETAAEYARRRPETARFAQAYTRLRYMPPERDRTAVMRELAAEYSRSRKQARGGSIRASLRQILSLRGLYYA
ncbi:MAG: transglutaminase-like domain-containing protein [Spirochaetia bacterium]